MKRLEDKIAIITGACGGLGEAFARAFVREGAKVILADILENDGKKLARELGENSLFVMFDVTDPTGWKTVVDVAIEKFGTVDVLVNNGIISSNRKDVFLGIGYGSIIIIETISIAGMA